ncbi:MAG TPA: hypothetical protein DCL21_02840, partial [Alphaproteobacteria bacterium]|nr:hypothetical protein [Alphaproteobacteria bacterium]
MNRDITCFTPENCALIIDNTPFEKLSEAKVGYLIKQATLIQDYFFDKKNKDFCPYYYESIAQTYSMIRQTISPLNKMHFKPDTLFTSYLEKRIPEEGKRLVSSAVKIYRECYSWDFKLDCFKKLEKFCNHFDFDVTKADLSQDLYKEMHNTIYEETILANVNKLRNHPSDDMDSEIQ